MALERSVTQLEAVRGESPHSAELLGARILIVDDQPANIRLLERMLQHRGFSDLSSTTDATGLLDLYDELDPDLILLDLHMPGMDGFQALAEIRARAAPDSYLPVLVLTADITEEAKQRALSLGAKDFLSKPFDLTEALLRIEHLLETRLLHVALRDHNLLLETRVRERTRDLEEARFEIVERLALATEYRDDDTHQHTQRVGLSSGLIARALGLAEEKADLIAQAAPLHDVGKIGISDTILLKPGRLTPEEFEVIKTHTLIGARILSGSRFPLLRLAEEIARYHHERWDGAGYAGLSGEDIPRSGRIVAVADAFDAMTHERPYRSAQPPELAVEEIVRHRERQFDPQVVDAFLTLDPTGLV
jgi:putative two-component system response regulator